MSLPALILYIVDASLIILIQHIYSSSIAPHIISSVYSIYYLFLLLLIHNKLYFVINSYHLSLLHISYQAQLPCNILRQFCQWPLHDILLSVVVADNESICVLRLYFVDTRLLHGFYHLSIIYPITPDYIFHFCFEIIIELLYMKVAQHPKSADNSTETYHQAGTYRDSAYPLLEHTYTSPFP